MRIVDASTESIKSCVRCLLGGKLIIYPTETVYGLGADATNENAVRKIFDVKGRNAKKPMSIAVAGVDQAKKLVEFNEIVDILAVRFLPGPLTLVAKAKVDLPWIVSDLGKIGIRIPEDRFAQELLSEFEKPIVATSANLSGFKEPRSFDEIDKELFSHIEIAVDGGITEYEKPSTVVEVLKKGVRVLREGVITEKEIERALNLATD